MAPEFDEQLWFLHRGCSGKHYVLGNPHTFPGRMQGWCLVKARSFFFSKSEVESASAEAAVWMAGFLSGNEPPPPRGPDGDVDFQGKVYKAWMADMGAFRASGVLPKTKKKAKG